LAQPPGGSGDDRRLKHILMDGLLSRFGSLTHTRHSWRRYWRIVLVRLQPLALPALAIGTLALGAVSGVLATSLASRKVQMALAGVFGLFVAFYRPYFMILLILAMSSTIIEDARLPRYRGFTTIEMCVVVLLGLVVTNALSSRRKEDGFVRTPLDWPIFLFFVASTVSLFNVRFNLFYARYHEETIGITANPIWRTLLTYMIFFAVTNFIRTRRQLMTLVGGMFVLATIVAALMIAQQAVGSTFSIIPGRESVEDATALGQTLVGATRVAIPGSAIVYVMLLPALILHATPEYLETRKWMSWIPVVLFPLAILFTFTRGLWIGAVLASAIYIITARFQGTNFILLVVVLVVAASLLLPLLNAYLPRVDTVLEALSLRALSLISGDELTYDSSTQWRLRENELALAMFQKYPILGIGPYGRYRAPWSEIDIYYNYARCRYIHNAYLYLLVDLGIVGFLPFLWFSIVSLLRGFFSWRTIQDPVLRSLTIGFAVSYIAVLVCSATSPRLVRGNYVPLIGVMLGINEVIIRLNRRSSRGEEVAT
jgi:O-antigen ligase